MKLAALLALSAALLAGCAGEDREGNTSPRSIWPHHVVTPDNREVLCIFEIQGNGGGLSCDWNNAVQLQVPR